MPFIATSVALGLLSDSVVDGLISPITPFRLADLGYRDVPAKVSYRELTTLARSSSC